MPPHCRNPSDALIMTFVLIYYFGLSFALRSEQSLCHYFVMSFALLSGKAHASPSAAQAPNAPHSSLAPLGGAFGAPTGINFFLANKVFCRQKEIYLFYWGIFAKLPAASACCSLVDRLNFIFISLTDNCFRL